MICGRGSRRVMRLSAIRGAFVTVVIPLVAAGCGRASEPPPPVPSAEGLLYGVQRCRSGSECASGACSLGTCQGYLTAPTEISRERLAAPLRAAAAADPALARELAGTLTDVLADRGSDAFIRGRAADAFRHLPPDLGREVLSRFLQDPEEPVRFFAARALHALGDPAGDAALRPFLDHRSGNVRELAREALEKR